MFSKLKWRLKRIWKGPGSIEHFDARSGWSLLIANSGGLEQKVKDVMPRAPKKAAKFLLWIVAAVLLAAIGFFVPYFLHKRFK